jgi:hypothetical protein
MAHAVVGGDVHRRLGGRGLGEHGVDVGRGRIGDHHRAGLGVDRLDLAHAVVLLHRGGQLVLADAVGAIVRDRCGRGEAGLHAIAPGQAIDIIERQRIADQHAGLDRALQVLGRLLVDRAAIGVDVRGKVDLGLGDVQEAPRLALGARAGFRA